MSSCIDIEVRRNSENSPWSYSDLNQRQNEIALRVAQGGKGTLLVSELAPVITYGRRTPEADLPQAYHQAQSGIALFPVDRGGLATYHGPGQWVLFPVERLEVLVGDPRGVKAAVCKLLEAACKVAREYEPQAEIREGAHLGVWTPRGKVSAVGIHIHQGILLHGVALNGFKTPLSFKGLSRPCGLDAPVDFLLPEDSERDFIELQKKITAAVLSSFDLGVFRAA